MVGFTNVPLRGDAIWIDFNPQVGHEQAGPRPAKICFDTYCFLDIFSALSNLCDNKSYEHD